MVVLPVTLGIIINVNRPNRRAKHSGDEDRPSRRAEHGGNKGQQVGRNRSLPFGQPA